jgi:hypothetical protein
LNNGFILKLLAPALLIALAFVLAAAGRPQGTLTDGVVDYFNVGSHAPSETFRSGDSQVLPNAFAHRPSKCLRLYEKSSSLIESESKITRIRSAFAIDLPLWELFASPTIVEIAAILDRNRMKHTSNIALVRMLGEVEAMTEEEAEEMSEIEKSIG